MTISTKLILGIAAAVLAGTITYSAQKTKARRRLNQVADEGYETAHDILFPENGKRGRLHYGPVLPL